MTKYTYNDKFNSIIKIILTLALSSLMLKIKFLMPLYNLKHSQQKQKQSADIDFLICFCN